MSCTLDFTRRSASTMAVSTVSGDPMVSYQSIAHNSVSVGIVHTSGCWSDGATLFWHTIWDRTYLARAQLAATACDSCSTVRFKVDLVAFICGKSGRLGPLYLWICTSQSTCVVMSSLRMRGILSSSLLLFSASQVGVCVRSTASARVDRKPFWLEITHVWIFLLLFGRSRMIVGHHVGHVWI